jgi:hypothetical protein
MENAKVYPPSAAAHLLVRPLTQAVNGEKTCSLIKI